MTATPTVKPPNFSPVKKLDPSSHDSIISSVDTVDIESESTTATTLASGNVETESNTRGGKQEKEIDSVVDATPTNGSGNHLDIGSGSVLETGDGSNLDGVGEGDSIGIGSGEAGGFSAGDESVTLWEESSVEGVPPPSAGWKDFANGNRFGAEESEGSSQALALDTLGGGAASGTITGSTGLSSAEGSSSMTTIDLDVVAKTSEEKEEMSQEDALAPTSAVAKEEEERGEGFASHTMNSAEAATDIPLARQQSIRTMDKNVTEGEGSNGEIVAVAALAAEATVGNPVVGKSADEAQETVRSMAAITGGGGEEEGAPVVPPATVSAGVVGWASGLFRCVLISFVEVVLKQWAMFFFFQFCKIRKLVISAGMGRNEMEGVCLLLLFSSSFSYSGRGR